MALEAKANVETLTLYLFRRDPGFVAPTHLSNKKRPAVEIVTVARAREMIERLKGWKTLPAPITT